MIKTDFLPEITGKHEYGRYNYPCIVIIYIKFLQKKL